MFELVVRRLRGLARVPGLPHLFDALLLGWTMAFRPARRRAMEALEAAVLALPGTRLRVHRLGGVEFVGADGRELGHLHGHGLLDVPAGKARAAGWIADGRARAHHVRARGGWVSFPLETDADVPAALALLLRPER